MKREQVESLRRHPVITIEKSKDLLKLISDDNRFEANISKWEVKIGNKNTQIVFELSFNDMKELKKLLRKAIRDENNK